MTEPTAFGYLADGRAVTEYTLSNRSGISAKILNYGGIIRVLEVPDRSGRSADVVLGFDELAAYEKNEPYFGAIVGRVAGRIARGVLPINGDRHQLTINNSPNHLHGGRRGFAHKLWDAELSADARTLMLTCSSPAGEEGYPGKLTACVTYHLSDADELTVQYQARTDATTAVNLTQHSYFNLSGEPGSDLADHQIKIQAASVLELDEHLLPTGRITGVAGSALDRRVFGAVADFDNYWVLKNDRELMLAAELRHASSGRTMQVLTTATGLQVYSGAALPAKLRGKAGASYGVSAGICLETQTHPDSPNQPAFPSILLEPGDEYRSMTMFRFGLCEQEQ